jgi:hypothetical protein
MPAIRSDFKKSNVYLGAHSTIGNKYLSPSTNLTDGGCFLNCLRGSSGKKVSLREFFRDFTNGCGGGIATWCKRSVLLEGYTGSALPMEMLVQKNLKEGRRERW